MNQEQLTKAARETVQSKFKGANRVRSKYKQMNPDSSEREMKRISNGYMRLVAGEFKSLLPEIIRQYEIETRNDSRMDGIRNINSVIRDGLDKISKSIADRAEEFALHRKLEETAKRVKKFSVREWKRSVERTLGVTLMDEYYSDEMYDTAMRKWADEREETFVSVPKQFADKIRDICSEGYKNGDSVSTVKHSIQKAYNEMRRSVSERAAASVPNLEAECTRITHRDAGVREYIWYTKHDSRVRPCHRSFEGKIFRWDDPPEIWTQKKDGTRTYTGRRCHPGEDFGCRCKAVPVYDMNTLSIPMTEKKQEHGAEKAASAEAR